MAGANAGAEVQWNRAGDAVTLELRSYMDPNARFQGYHLDTPESPCTSATLLCRISCSNRSAACVRRRSSSTGFNSLRVRVLRHSVYRT